MSRPSREYWESRFAALEALAYGEGTLIYADIEKAYRRAVKDVEKDIALWYLLFSDDEISYSEATKYLTSKELANFKMDVNDYIKSASSAYISTSWAKQLEKVAARHRITRLESIMVQLQQHLEKLFGKQEQLLSEGLARIYNDTYYETAFEVFKGYGIGHEFAGINTDKLEEVLKKPWAPDGSNFPDRVWKHKDVLVNTLAQEMTRAVIRGDDYKTATDNIAEKMNVSRRAAGRLVYTESAYFASKSAINSFKELGVEKYEFIATLDRRTSQTCRNFDGKIFPVKDYKPGTNAPPMHCHCRSHIMPYLEDAHEEERVARGNDGKIYYVPGNMKYKDWKAVYVDKTISLEEWKKRSNAKSSAENARETSKNTVNAGLQSEPKERIINIQEKIVPIKPTKVITTHSRTPITDDPNTIVGYKDNDKGIVKKRVFYDEQGSMSKQIHTTDHGNPKEHPYGEHGEHAHDFSVEEGKLSKKSTRELTDVERKENGDIL